MLWRALRKDALELVARLKQAYRERSPGYAPEPAPELPGDDAQPITRTFRALGFEPHEKAVAVTAARWFSEEYPAREGLANCTSYQLGQVTVTLWREGGVIHAAHARYFYDYQGEEE